MNKIVVLTGSFNPVTKAHYKILSDAVEFVNADKGLFVATNNAYLTKKTMVKSKSKTSFILSEELRENMLNSLNKHNPKLFFGGFELGGASPATDKTINKILKENKDSELYFLCGADKLIAIPKWNNVEHLFTKIKLIVYCRFGIDVDSIISNNSFLNERRDRIFILNTSDDIEDISSTILRKKFFNHEDYSDLMMPAPYEIMKTIDPSDFKEPTVEDVIKCTIMYGGRFGGNAARILVYKENTRLFNNWDSKKLGDRLSKIKETKVYKEPFKVNSSNNFNTTFTCKNIDCVDETLNLINQGFNPAILNLASNKHPGGGYDSGANAQEESLCQMSTLSQSLYQFGNPKLKYFKDAHLEHIEGVYPMDINYGGIYSPNVCFFRNNLENYYSLRDKVFECSVISVASLSNRQKNDWTDDESNYFNELGYLNNEGKEIELNKIRTIYRIALDNNHDSLVLGAFGCGVYNLMPDEVSKLFLDVLNEPEFKNKFKHISFAIYEGKGTSRKVVGENGKFKPFYERFK